MSRKRRITLSVCVVLLVSAGLAAFLWFAPASPYRFGNYIPENLDDAHAYLFKYLPPEEIQRIREMKSEKEMIDYHFGLGMGMRNGWALWAGSRLSRHFNQLGIYHPDDMSGIILDTFWCRLHNQPLRLDERVAYYRAYWQAANVPERLKTPSGEFLQFNTSYHRGSDEHPRIIHIARSNDGTVWTYEHDKGLQPMSPETQKVIDDYKPDR